MNIGEPITGIDSRFLNKAGIGIFESPFELMAAAPEHRAFRQPA
jgi:hypothetical protein